MEMFNDDGDKIYVVFDGRKRGIYFSWRHCHVQVNRYKGASYKGYECYDKAWAEWLQHCMDIGRDESYARSHIHHRNKDVASTSSDSSTQRRQLMGRMGCQLAEDTSVEDFILQESMQNKLLEACNVLMIPAPVYTLHEVRVMNETEYRRYHAILQSGAMGTPAVSIGRFGKTDFDAKEDVAANLLRRLMAATGRKIRDYNHYNVEILEDQLQKTMDANFELEMEVAILNEELRLMKA